MSLSIGPWTLPNNVILAPMAGVTDLPFRQLCRELGAGLVVSEMLSANPKLRQSKKSLLRSNHEGEPEPIAVQIAGSDPQLLAEAAQYNVDNGAQIIDINMGCPAKKVCKKAAGSALLADPKLVQEICQQVVSAVDIPVTLKIRTGPDQENINAPQIGLIAQDAGIQSLAIHGRTRADKFLGEAEYETIATVKQQLSIPVIANGDITNVKKAKSILEYTKADGIMVGRSAQGNPWIFQQITHYLQTGEELALPSLEKRFTILKQHLQKLHAFYGEYSGVRIARKHVGWYLQHLQVSKALMQGFNRLTSAVEQLVFLEHLAALLYSNEALINKGEINITDVSMDLDSLLKAAC